VPQVALLMQLTLKGQVDIFRGVLQYVRLHGPWRLYRMEGRPGEQRLFDLKRWGCTGIITDACDTQEAGVIASLGVPVIVCEPSPTMRQPTHPLAACSCSIFNSYACMGADIAVPDQIAVLGVDNDELICEATFPALSSVQTVGQQTGYLIAEHLDRLMRGGRLGKRIFTGTPTHVVTRASTDVAVIPDRHVARALQFIWDTAGSQPLRVPDVVSRIGSSRRFAEIRFKNVVGRTILEEIQRVRLERVASLLSDTDLSISEITQRCDFANECYLARLFKKRFGRTMSDYRAATRDM